MEALARFLDVARWLVGFTPEAVGEALGCDFALEQDHAPSYRLMRAEGAGKIEDYELRSPGEGAPFGGLLIASLARPVLRGEVEPLIRGRFQGAEPPPPEAPPGMSYWYKVGRNRLAVCCEVSAGEPVVCLALHGCDPA